MRSIDHRYLEYLAYIYMYLMYFPLMVHYLYIHALVFIHILLSLHDDHTCIIKPHCTSTRTCIHTYRIATYLLYAFSPAPPQQYLW
jgi:hypothetical protein